MRLTVHTDYSIRTLIYLAVREDKLATISDISEQYQISKNHMMKVAQELVHQGFVVSERGRHGGLRLARPPSEINLGLRYSFDQGDEATRLEKAIEKVLADGVRTADLLGEEGVTPVSTSEMGDAIVAALDASL